MTFKTKSLFILLFLKCLNFSLVLLLHITHITIKEKLQSNQFWWKKNSSLSKTNNHPFRAVPTKLIHDWTPSRNIFRVFKHLIDTSSFLSGRSKYATAL